jgi:hypothetical protein
MEPCSRADHASFEWLPARLMTRMPSYLFCMESVSLIYGGVASEHEALIIDGDSFQSADRGLATLAYLLWLESGDSGMRFRDSVRISGTPGRPLAVRLFERNAFSWRRNDEGALLSDGTLLSEVESELYFDDSRERLELCLCGTGPLARLDFHSGVMQWVTAIGDGQLAVVPLAWPAVSLLATGPRLRVSALA